MCGGIAMGAVDVRIVGVLGGGVGDWWDRGTIRRWGRVGNLGEGGEGLE